MIRSLNVKLWILGYVYMDNKNVIIVMKIMAYIDKIDLYIANVDKSAFLSDTKLIEACVFNLLQIGELANRVGENFQHTHPDIPWHKMRGLRNRLVHDYEGVNLELVWDVVKSDLETLRKQLANI